VQASKILARNSRAKEPRNAIVTSEELKIKKAKLKSGGGERDRPGVIGSDI
jgi:hypothetical protein